MSSQGTLHGGGHLALSLLGRFCVREEKDQAEKQIDVVPVGQKLLAVVALLGGAAHRNRVASTIWPDSSDTRALANLRAAMWRLPDHLRPQLERHGMSIRLSSAWRVDVDEAVAAERQLRTDRSGCGIDRRLFAADLLPDWDAEWLVVLRERHRQLRLHALEALAQLELAEGRSLDAVDTALQAVSAEPLRESAQLLLLKAHLGAGNRAQVMREFDRFKHLLAHELGVAPSPAMEAVFRAAKGASDTR